MKRGIALLLLACFGIILASCGGADASPSVSPGLQTETPGGDGSPDPLESALPVFGESPTPGETTPPTPGETPVPTPDPTPAPAPDNLVEYTGDLHHVFFHYLIAYPDIAYSTSYGRNLDTDCITPTEFRRSLEQLYQNNYVLYDLNAYITIHDDGTVVKNKIMVPEGKKPLVMSFDDINYYEAKLGMGICNKVILDENGELAMLTIDENGGEQITYDNDVIPMLEAFCREFPDFAPFGVKGMLALTGYDGILGYRVQRDTPNRDSEIEAVKPIIQALKDKGWYFASHSYGHIRTDSVSLDRVVSDTYNWANEIQPLLGETSIYVFAFGDTDKSGKTWDDHNTAKYKAVIDSGFKILCGVGMPPYFRMYNDHAFMDRQNIDGHTLRNQRKYFAGLLDPEAVYCQAERGGIPISG